MSTSDPTLSSLRDRDVGVLGVGREGLAVRERLREQSPDRLLTFYSEAPVPAATRNALGEHDQIVEGPLEPERLKQHEVLVRSPGVSPYRTACRLAREAGVIFTSGTDLWLAEYPDAKTLAITGTKGKSTTSSLLAHLLRATGARATVAGNIGVPLLEFGAADADWWVLELSSYQLSDLQHGPGLGVLLNLSDEHLDWHGGAVAYRRDKLRLAELSPPGRLVANYDDTTLVEALPQRQDVIWFNHPAAIHRRGDRLFDAEGALPGLPGLPGAHNLDNLAAALTVLDRVARRPDDLETVLGDFEGLPHRLSTLGMRNEVRFIDDSLSTTPVATLAAMEALAGEQVTVILGGLDRGIDWAAHAPAFLAASPHGIVGLPDSGAAIIDTLARAGLAPPGGMVVAEDMTGAVRCARGMTPAGGVVLLSPGAPSFPRYRDYRDRALAFANEALGDDAGKSETAGSQG